MNNNLLNAMNDQYTKRYFEKIENNSLFNQEKVLNAFKKYRVSQMHFAQTNGYGYGDIGRETLCALYSEIFCTQAAIVGPFFMSGTHAIFTALRGLLRSGDTMLSVTGGVYDTLKSCIAGGRGSLDEFGIKYCEVPLTADGNVHLQSIKEKVEQIQPRLVYIQRSRGYEWRRALCCADIEKIVSVVKTANPKTVIFVDNCYGEFVEQIEPTQVGCDVCAGSLIKNIGGGYAQTGGYIVGDNKSIDLISSFYSAPSVGREIGSYVGGYLPMYQGLFAAPHVVSQALKTSTLASRAFNLLGYDALPKLEHDDNLGDIICSIKFNDKDKLIKFCQLVQQYSPVDSHVVPYPWDMPGYDNQVIMAAGCFVSGSSIELSCDAPLRPPYIAYLQGSLTFEHGIVALSKILDAIF